MECEERENNATTDSCTAAVCSIVHISLSTTTVSIRRIEELTIDDVIDRQRKAFFGTCMQQIQHYEPAV